MERIRLLRSTDIAQDLDRLLSTDISYDDLRTIATGAVFDEQERLYYLRVASWAEENHVPLSSIPGLMDALRNSFRRSMLLMDDTSLLGSIYVDRMGSGASKDWRELNVSRLAANLRPAGQFVRIIGPPRTGKTNVACILIEEWVKQDGLAITNIRMRDVVPLVVFVDSTSGLLGAVADAWDMGRPWLFVYDEIGLTYLRARAITPNNISQDRLVRVVGKFDGRGIFIEQRETGIPTIVEEFSTQLYRCERVGGGHVSVDLHGPEVFLRERYHNVPLSSLPFESTDPAFLKQDCDIEAAISAVTGVSDKSRALREALMPKPAKRAKAGRPPKYLKSSAEN